MQVLYDEIAINDCWPSCALSANINTATILPTINKITRVDRHPSARLSHMLLQKYSKLQHIFAYNGLQWETTVP